MEHASMDSSSSLVFRARRALPALALVGAVAFAAWIGIGWWRHYTHPPAPPDAAVPAVPAWAEATNALIASAPFGRAEAGATALPAAVDLRLKGVFAGAPDRPAAAIIHVNGRDMAARVGRDVLPGLTLVAVEPRSITVQRAGVLQRVVLEEHRGGVVVGQAAPPAKPVPAPATATPAAPPASESHPGRRYRRPDPYAPVGDSPTDPDPPSGASPAPAAPKPAPPAATSPRSGVPATDVIGAAQLAQYGLQPDDVIQTVNGRPVASRLELARLAAELRGQPVTVEVGRGAGTVRVQFNAP
jgi:general secretion pathway protein C